MLTTISTNNPYKLGLNYFCECPECKEHRKISKNTYYAINRKANPVSKRCQKCFGLSKRIDKEYKLQCDDCKKIFEVSSTQMCRYRKVQIILKIYNYFVFHVTEKNIQKAWMNLKKI